MKWISCVLALVCLSSCNTFIGIGRDMREGVIWAGNKAEESKQPDASEENAPVY